MMLELCTGNVLKILNADAAVPSREMEKELLQVQKVDIIYAKRKNYVKDILKMTEYFILNQFTFIIVLTFSI